MTITTDLWAYISNTGIDDTMDERLMRKVKLTNQIVFLACTGTFIQLFAFASISGYPMICAVSIMAYAITWWLNMKKKWNFSRFYFVVISCIAILISGSLVSVDTNISFRFMLVQAFVLPLVVFDISEAKYLFFGFVCYVASFIAFDHINAAIPVLEGVDTTMFDSPVNIIVNGILCMATLFIGFRYLQKLNFSAEQKLFTSLEISQHQREQIEKKNKDIQDGINYAQRIQKAILPHSEDIKVCLPEHFVYYKPKEKIGGDFFWYGEFGDHIVFAAVDCTGHGTPGALISIIGCKLLDKIIKEQGITDPAHILELLNLEIISTLQSDWSVVKDGMDVALVSIDSKERTMTYAGAKNSLLLLQDGEINRIKGDRCSIGETYILEEGFTNHTIELNKDDCVYMTTDGILDQFGGPKNKKLMNRRLYDILQENSKYSMTLQDECLKRELAKWQGSYEQIDDILVIGFRVDFDYIASVKIFRDNPKQSRKENWQKTA